MSGLTRSRSSVLSLAVVLGACQPAPTPPGVVEPGTRAATHPRPTSPAIAKPELPTPGPPLEVTMGDGSTRELGTPAIAGIPAAFHLVAAREGRIELHPDRHATPPRMILGATLPYPVAADGSVETLPGVYRGLVPLSVHEPVEQVELVGGFTGDGDGWLRIVGEMTLGIPPPDGVPLSYAWRGDHWQLLRDRRGAFVGLHTSFVSRGDTVWAGRYYQRLPSIETAYVPYDPEVDLSQGAPSGGLERLAGSQPYPPMAGSCMWLGTSSDAAGALTTTAWLPNDDDSQTLHLLHFEAGQSSYRALPVPDVAAQPVGSHKLCLATTELPTRAGVAVYGWIELEGHKDPVAYLAVGGVDGLRRVPIEVEGMAVRAELSDVVERSDGSFWLILDRGLWERSSGGVLRALQLPHVAWPVSTDWTWEFDDTWSESHEFPDSHERARPLLALEIEQLGEHAWLRVGLDLLAYGEDIEAVLTTGPHREPIVLPSTAQTMGEMRRFSGEVQALRVATGLDEAGVADFVAAHLDTLTAREEVWQLYETGTGDQLDVIMLVDPRDWDRAMARTYAKLLGRQPQALDVVPPCSRVLSKQ